MGTRFGNLTETPAPAEQKATGAQTDGIQENRRERKAISGYFSPAMSIAMRTTAMRRGITLQEAMAEAFNLWLRDQGESPIGE